MITTPYQSSQLFDLNSTFEIEPDLILSLSGRIRVHLIEGGEKFPWAEHQGVIYLGPPNEGLLEDGTSLEELTWNVSSHWVVAAYDDKGEITLTPAEHREVMYQLEAISHLKKVRTAESEPATEAGDGEVVLVYKVLDLHCSLGYLSKETMRSWVEEAAMTFGCERLRDYFPLVEIQGSELISEIPVGHTCSLVCKVLGEKEGSLTVYVTMRAHEVFPGPSYHVCAATLLLEVDRFLGVVRE